MTKLPKIKKCMCGATARALYGLLSCDNPLCGWGLEYLPFTLSKDIRSWNAVMKAAKAAKRRNHGHDAKISPPSSPPRKSKAVQQAKCSRSQAARETTTRTASKHDGIIKKARSR